MSWSRSHQDRRTILVRLDAGETQLKRLPDRDGGGSFDEGLREISTKSLEEQWQLLGTLEALQRITSVRTDHRLAVRHGSDLRGGATAVVYFEV